MRNFFYLLCLSIGITSSSAQYQINVTVKSKKSNSILLNASVTEGKKGLKVVKDEGVIMIKKLDSGIHKFLFTHIGYTSFDTTVTIPETKELTIYLEPNEQALEEVLVVASTRSNQAIENSPLKVEVLDKAEMDEETTIKPANIGGLLNDLSGVQIQQSSQVSGNSNVRIQGLDGRYTQIVRDGMPLFDGFSGGFGIMQLPPLDLKQIELIKGAASTLYGGGAIGGLVNVISKKPSYEQEGIFLFNQTSLKESNLNTYLSKRNKKFGYNFFGGITHQEAVDVNGDGFSDVPKLDATIIHPRLFYYPTNKTSIAIGYTGTFETRKGGDMQVLANHDDLIHSFFESSATQRNTGDVIIEQSFSGGKKLEIKSSFSSFNRAITTHSHYFKGNQNNYFAEASFLIPSPKYSWVMGINAIGNEFKVLPSDPILLTNFSNYTIGVFTQLTAKLFSQTTIEAGLRTDHQATYGNFFLPRLAIFHRINQHWATRAGVGFGYSTPNPLSVQNQDYAIEQLQPLPLNIEAEKSVGYNAEFNFKQNFEGSSYLFINQAFFLTQVNNPVIATQLNSGLVNFSNAGSNVTTQGSDTYIKMKLDEWELYAGYTYTIANRNYLTTQKQVPLTPQNRFSFIGTYELEGEWKFGLEVSYTGSQYRDGDTKTLGYPIFAALIEKIFSEKLCMVLNCEDLLDYRQSNQEALYAGPINNPDFKPLWAPTDGRVFNLSIRWDWGKK